MSCAVKAGLPARPRMVSFRQSTEACIKLVQISVRSDLCKLHLAYFSFLFVTVAARHLLRPICLPLFPPPLSTLGQYPTTSTFVGALGVSLALSSPFRRHKATCSVNSSTPRLGFPRRLFFHFYDTFFSLRHLSLDYSLLHCVANNLSFPLVLLPDLGLRHTVIERTFTRLVEQLLHFMNLDLLFLDEIWFVLGVSPTSWVYSTVFYGFSLSPSRSFFFSSAFQLIVRSFIHLRHSLLSSNIHYLLYHDHPFPSSIEIDASVFLESLFEDTFGAFAWSMVIDWSIFWNMFR